MIVDVYCHVWDDKSISEELCALIVGIADMFARKWRICSSVLPQVFF